MTGRLVLLSTSPRVAPGLLSWQAWQALHSCDVRTGSAENPLLPYLHAAGVHATVEDPTDVDTLARRLVERASSGDRPLLWVADQDEGLDVAVATAVVGSAAPPELEILPGSYDLPGARVLDLVAVMDRLRSPGGCPWDAEQTHESLVTYLVEETYETVEAIESGDRDHLREELGDLLLQVVFHARIAAEHPEDAWAVDDVAADIVAKLVRRHPHVFAGAEAPDVTVAESTWEALKAQEKGRRSVLDGIPPGLPALALASKALSRAQQAGLDDVGPAGTLGERLFALAREARAARVDPEAALRGVVRRYAEAVRGREQAGPGPALPQTSPGRAEPT